MSTLYDIFGVIPTAPQSIIKAAYKTLILEYHPDKNVRLPEPDINKRTATFHGIQEAFEILSDPERRAAYDAHLREEDEAHPRPASHPSPTDPHPAGATKPAPHGRAGHVLVTTPRLKATMERRVALDLDMMQRERELRNDLDNQLDEDGIRYVLSLWRKLAIEQQDRCLRAHCQAMVTEYEQKLAQREKERRDWSRRTAGRAPSRPNTSAWRARAAAWRDGASARGQAGAAARPGASSPRTGPFSSMPTPSEAFPAPSTSRPTALTPRSGGSTAQTETFTTPSEHSSPLSAHDPTPPIPTPNSSPPQPQPPSNNSDTTPSPTNDPLPSKYVPEQSIRARLAEQRREQEAKWRHLHKEKEMREAAIKAHKAQRTAKLARERAEEEARKRAGAARRTEKWLCGGCGETHGSLKEWRMCGVKRKNVGVE